MALRFRCEHCGKRLQVDQPPGTRVGCPYCRNVLTVPADAEDYSPGALPTQARSTQQDAHEPAEEGRLATAAAYLPSWGTSVVLHLSLILVALMGTWMIVRAEPKPNIHAEFRPRSRAQLDRRHHQPASRTTREPKSTDHSVFVFKPTQNVKPGLTNNNLRPVEVIGVGGGGDKDGGFPRFGKDRGRGGPEGGWFPVSRRANRIVYVIDRSGSMTDSIMYVKYELKRAIRHLWPSQRFHVLFYSTGPAIEMPSGKLLVATEGNKGLAYEFVDNIVPVGGTDPSDALKRAFKLKPDVIFLLTDGEFDKPKEIQKLIDRLNRGKEVKVNTLGFLYTGMEWLLQKIAHGHNGEYKFIGEGDLETLGR